MSNDEEITISDNERTEILKNCTTVHIYKDKLSMVSFLTDEEAGKLLKAIYEYRVNQKLPLLEEESNTLQLVFSQMKAGFDNDDKKYIHQVLVNRGNGQKGGRPKKPNKTEWVSSETENNPTKPYTDTETKTRTRTGTENTKKTKSKTNFEGRNYDFDELEREALGVKK